MSRRCPLTSGQRPPPPSTPRGPRCVRPRCSPESLGTWHRREKGAVRHSRATGSIHALRQIGHTPMPAAVPGTCIPGPHLVPAAAPHAAAPPEPPEPPEPPADDEIGVKCPLDCGAHGTHQAQFRFELRAGKQRSVRKVGDGWEGAPLSSDCSCYTALPASMFIVSC